MKRLLLSLLVIIVIAFAAIYLFIPDTISLNERVSFPANRQGVSRIILDKTNWSIWWPGKQENDSSHSSVSASFYNGNHYDLSNQNAIVMYIPVEGKQVKAKTSLSIIPLTHDSIALAWEGLMITSYNPIARVQAFFKSRSLKKDMQTILKSMETYFINPENVYGINIRQEKVVDSFLIATTTSCKGYPEPKLIYSLVTRLKQYANSYSVSKIGFPMMNVRTLDSVNYDMMVALPINKELPVSSDVINKKMIIDAKILTTEVTGGQQSVNNAFQKLEIFIKDYQLSTPAIPFFSLISDRTQQPDSSAWITKIYYPVM